MTPLLLTLVVAAAAASATYGALALWRAHHPGSGFAGSEPDAMEEVSEPTRVLGTGVALAILAIAGLFLGGLVREIERGTALVRWDDRVERWASDNAGNLGSDALRLITHLGDTLVVVILATLAAVSLIAIRRRRLALFVVIVVFGQWALANLIKEVTARARPALDPLAPFSGYSFPSGHSTAAAATYLALALVLVATRPGWDTRLVVSGAVGLGAAVAASRTLLGVHWFSDVLGGLVLGWAWCFVCAWAVQLTDTRNGSEDRVAYRVKHE